MTTPPLIVGLGEAMIRFTAQGYQPLATATDFRANVAGSELNVLTVAAALGLRSRFVTRLPENDLATMVRRTAQAAGVEVEAIVEPSARLGTFFLEVGVPPRASKVLYDRTDSAASHLGPKDFEWAAVVSGARIAHSTGITCALGGAQHAVRAFFDAAREAGILTSFDVNYRSQLWPAEEAAVVLRRVIHGVTVLFASVEDLGMLLGESLPLPEAAQRVRDTFEVSTVVVRERTEQGGGELAVRVNCFGEAHATAEASGTVIDELGAGDAAAGAFLAAVARGESPDEQVRQAARAYARMLTLPGDGWVGSREDLDGGFRVGRTLVR